MPDTCPKCGHSEGPDDSRNEECPKCGIVFAKYAAKSRPPEPGLVPPPVPDADRRMAKPKSSGKIKILIFAIVIAAAILVANHVGFESVLFSLLSGGTYEVTQATDNFTRSKASYETIDIAQIVELRKMLREGRFHELNDLLETYQEAFEKNQADEYKLYDAYGAFSLTLPDYEEYFLNWADATPDNYQPYLGIAQYQIAKAWESRGHKFSKDTSEKQFEGMGSLFKKAADNLRTALEIDPNLMLVYNDLIVICNALGDEESENRLISKTRELFPHSFLIRSTSLWAKEPRWGGSHSMMEEIAKEAEKHSDKNPSLTVLYGFIYYDQGTISSHNKKYEKALELFDKALFFGEHWSFYHERAKIHWIQSEHDKAIEDLNRSIELRPVVDEIFLMRSKVHYDRHAYADSIADFHTADTLRPGKKEIRQWKHQAAENLKNDGHRVFKTDTEQAVEYYDRSLEFEDNDFETYYWRGAAFDRLKNDESALADFETAIEINPGHFESYRMIDRVLSRSSQWDAIIGYWDKFLEIDPDHAEATYQRSGTHYHNKNMEAAMRDLKTACQLGSEKACKRYEKMSK